MNSFVDRSGIKSRFLVIQKSMASIPYMASSIPYMVSWDRNI